MRTATSASDSPGATNANAAVGRRTTALREIRRIGVGPSAAATCGRIVVSARTGRGATVSGVAHGRPAVGSGTTGGSAPFAAGLAGADVGAAADTGATLLTSACGVSGR